MTRSAVPSSQVSNCAARRTGAWLTGIVGLVGQALELRAFYNGHCGGAGLLVGFTLDGEDTYMDPRPKAAHRARRFRSDICRLNRIVVG